MAPLLEESGDDPVNRRQFLAATTVLALQDSSETSALGWRDVRQVELAVQGLTALDDAQGGDDLFEIAAGQLQRVQSLLNETSYTDEMGSRLLRAAGRLAEHTGWLAFDAYRHQAARAYFNEALYLAELAGDSQLAVLTFASMSMQARHAGRLRESVAAARAARERAARWAPPRLLSELWIREAYALAEMRDPQFRKALHEAYRAFECSDPPAADDWYAFYDDAHFLVSEASCNARFGDHRRAVAVWSQALRQHDASYVRNHALYNLAYADSLVRVKELEEACHVGSIGAEILKRGVTSTRTRVRLQQLVSAMRGFRSEPVAAEFLARYGNMAA
ncbi:hypothetical protein [Carbonactinospora thermoautotrophica]|uniref:hypothetical protein n=1 Tax=Carbonactinospora thermoautotrophica TaxID=1469144 RepID=UPI00130172D4|nr:hypothetical protein [Carbonactinospora thermoautotrophica]